MGFSTCNVRGQLLIAYCSICLLLGVFQLLYTGGYFASAVRCKCAETQSTVMPMFHSIRGERMSPSTPAVVKKTSSTPAVFKKRQRMVLTSTNAAYIKVAENLVASIHRIGTPSFPNVTVVVEDVQSYNHMANLTKLYSRMIVHKTSAGMTISKSLKWRTKEYNHFVKRRSRYVLEFLEKGYEVLFADTDTFWLKDPFKDFEGDFDIAAHNEVDPPRQPVFCDGFVYYRPTNNTISLIKEWVKLLDTTDKDTMDQYVFNRLINRELDKNVTGGLKMKTLDPVSYPDGRLYYRVPDWREKHINQTVVMHFTYVHGLTNKINKMKELGWWLV